MIGKNLEKRILRNSSHYYLYPVFLGKLRDKPKKGGDSVIVT